MKILKIPTQFFNVLIFNMKYILLFISFIAFSQENRQSFESKPIDAIGSFQFRKSYYYDYKINSKSRDSIVSTVDNQNTPESIITRLNQDFLESNTKENPKFIVLLSKIIIEYNQQEFCFIKYSLRENSLDKYQIVTLINKNQKWEQFIGENQIIAKIQLLLRLNNTAFAHFEIRENSDKYKIIDNLKLSIRDADGTINLFKFAEVVEKNLTNLEKFIDK